MASQTEPNHMQILDGDLPSLAEEFNEIPQHFPYKFNIVNRRAVPGKGRQFPPIQQNNIEVLRFG